MEPCSAQCGFFDVGRAQLLCRSAPMALRIPSGNLDGWSEELSSIDSRRKKSRGKEQERFLWSRESKPLNNVTWVLRNKEFG